MSVDNGLSFPTLYFFVAGLEAPREGFSSLALRVYPDHTATLKAIEVDGILTGRIAATDVELMHVMRQ